MSFQAALIVASFVIFVAVFFVLSRLSKGRIQQKEEDLRKAATVRGWTFDKKHDRGYRIYRFSGTTEGVAWEAESLQLVAGGNRHQRRRHIARWHGRWNPGVNAPIVALGVPKGKELMGAGVAQGDGFFARMAVKAAGFAFDKALDVYFGEQIGKEIDAGALRRVENPAVPGFIVMAGNVDEASRILSEGLHRALVEASHTRDHLLAGTDRPYVLVRPQGISLARMEQFRDVTEIDQFIRAGIGLARAFRFGRPGN
jgi:hypothetical protein